MSNTIEVTEIRAEGNRIHYTVQDNSGMRLLKKQTVHAWIQFDHTEEFGFDLSSLPFSVLAIPISLYLLPVTYYYPVTLALPVMDEMLQERLPVIRAEYEKIYGPFPQKELRVRAGKTERNDLPAHPAGYEKIVFFSGGVDAVSAGVNNSGAKTVLVSIPSIEAKSKNEGALRDMKYRLISDFSEVVGSPWILISNNFNDDVFNDRAIGRYVNPLIYSNGNHETSWVGTKYLANMSCVAPFAYANGIPTLVMGSALEQLEQDMHTNRDGVAPELTAVLAFAGISFAGQDEQYTRRQKKVENIIRWCREHGKTTVLWTCFEDRQSQCGVCNKCVRTQLDILVGGESPKDWGFALFDEKKFSRLIRSYSYHEKNPCWLWDIIDAIDDTRMYPCCDTVLHWLKKIGWRAYFKRARAVKLLKSSIIVHRWPRYAAVVLHRIRGK